MLQKIKNRNGFTLIEIMIVVVILALLAALVAPKIMGRSDDARIADAKVQIRNMETGLKLYKLDNAVFPTTEQGLQALVTKPTTGVIPKNWRSEGYLEGQKVPQDPWGNDYVYISPSEHGDYEICSYGADGVKGGEGKNADICNYNIQ
ncbi:MAG: type II secretion system major pseudopilin GspG [Desulfuromonadales bacterium]|nr:type II secretion system major pseudopilin GspG [Desulfuromonadales bacterium]